MGDTPIEITIKDIVKRPAELAAAGGAVKKGNIISQFKQGLEQFKEIKDLMKDLGIDLGDLLGGQPKNALSGLNAPPRIDGAPPPADTRAPAPPPPSPGMTPAQQFKAFCVMLQLKYGDITISEMLDAIKAEYGNKKISDFIKGK